MEQTRQPKPLDAAPVSMERILAQLGKEHLELCLARDMITQLDSRNQALARSIESLNQTITDLQAQLAEKAKHATAQETVQPSSN
jgi:predicted RNase H-like nuclease (RuvC/YqgF family)